MIKYSTHKSDLNRRALAIAFAELLVPTIVAIIMFAATPYFLIVGFLYDKEALSYGFTMLAACVIDFVMYILFSLKFKKQVESVFDECAIDGVIEYDLEKVNDKFYLNSDQCNRSMTFSQEDISYVRIIGKTIVVRLKDRTVLSFPKTDEIRALLKRSK